MNIDAKNAASLQAKPANIVTAVISPDHFVALDPPVPLLEPMLTYSRRSFSLGGSTGFQQAEEEVSLSGFDPLGRLCFPAGLLPRLSALLREHGYEVQIDDLRKPEASLEIGEGVIDHHNGADRRLLEAVAREPLGQIEVTTMDNAVQTSLLIGDLFPKAGIVVAVASRKHAWELWSKLEKLLWEDVGLAMGRVKRSGWRWLVATFGSLNSREAGKWDILLVPVAEQVLGNRAIESIVGMHFRRIYAFISPQRRMDQVARLRLEQIVGPVIYRAAKTGARVRAVLIPTPPCRVQAGESPLERKRALYWHNPARNNHIATVARAIADQDVTALLQLGLRKRDLGALERNIPLRVVVLVEALEHGRQLSPLLPAWPMVDGLTEMAGKPTKGQKKKKNRVPTPAIVSAVYAGISRIRADVVIRATGTEWPLRMKNFPPAAKDETTTEVLLIDFMDEFDIQANRDTQCRVLDYRRRGMTVVMPKRIIQTKQRDQSHRRAGHPGGMVVRLPD